MINPLVNRESFVNDSFHLKSLVFCEACKSNQEKKSEKKSAIPDSQLHIHRVCGLRISSLVFNKYLLSANKKMFVLVSRDSGIG